jgi:SAM-dependent methyltransferase
MIGVFKEALLIRKVRMLVGKMRFYYLVFLCRRVKTIESTDAIDQTVKHNFKALGAFGGTRMDKIIRPISVLENISKNSNVLVIGPRNEEDILTLIGNGFNKKNIIGLDLISYSPYIEVGDMHNTRFEDSTFDVIICGWTLSYSHRPDKFASEVLRIIKDGGVVGIGVEFSTLSKEQSMKIHGGYHLHTENFERINSTDQILKLFSGHVKHVFFNHDAPNRISHGDQMVKNVSNVIAIFSITK